MRYFRVTSKICNNMHYIFIFFPYTIGCTLIKVPTSLENGVRTFFLSQSRLCLGPVHEGLPGRTGQVLRVVVQVGGVPQPSRGRLLGRVDITCKDNHDELNTLNSNTLISATACGNELALIPTGIVIEEWRRPGSAAAVGPPLLRVNLLGGQPQSPQCLLLLPPFLFQLSPDGGVLVLVLLLSKVVGQGALPKWTAVHVGLQRGSMLGQRSRAVLKTLTCCCAVGGGGITRGIFLRFFMAGFRAQLKTVWMFGNLLSPNNSE